MLALAVLNCATTNRGANSKKFNFIFETKRWREGESPDEFVPTGDLGLFSTSSSPFFLSPTLRQFSTNGQTIKVVCTGKHQVEGWIHIFTVRLLFEYIEARGYFSPLTIVRLARRRGGSRSGWIRIVTAVYAYLRTRQEKDWLEHGGGRCWKARDRKRNAFSGRRWWLFVTRGNVFIPWKYRFTMPGE